MPRGERYPLLTPGWAWLLGALLFLLPQSGGAQTEAGPKLSQVAQELEANLRELRRNLTAWDQLRRDPGLSAAERDVFRERARIYLQACQDYDHALAGLPEAKLRCSPMGQKVLELRKTFRQECRFLAEQLEQP